MNQSTSSTTGVAPASASVSASSSSSSASAAAGRASSAGRRVKRVDPTLPRDASMYGTPGWVVKLGGVVGIALVLSGLAGAGLAAGEIASQGVATRATSWAVLFELSIALAGVFAALLLIGKFKSGPCMTMLVSGGCAVLGVPLMDLSIATGLIGRGANFLEFSGVSSMTIAIGNLVPAFGLIALAGLGTFLRAPGATIPRFVIGSGLLVSLPAAYVLVGVPSFSVGSGAAGAVVTALIWAVILGAVLIVVSVGVHLVARSIEIGIEAGLPGRGGERGG